MKPANRNRGSMTGYSCLVLGVVVLAGAVQRSAARDGAFVMPDGREYKLTPAPMEFGVILKSADEADEFSRRLSDKGLGSLKPFRWAPHGRMQLLKLADADTAKLSAIRKDAAVQDVQPIYYFEGVEEPVISTGTIVIRVREDLTDAQRRAFFEGQGLRELRPVAGLPGVYVVEPTLPGDTDVAAAERLTFDPRTVWATPNFRRPVQLRQLSAADEFFNLQWHLHNTGQTRGTNDADIDAPEAWELASGAGVLIGMYDDSCDVDHEDLTANYSGMGHDAGLPVFDADANNPRPKFFFDAHGTAVMGLAAAAVNSIGVRGVAHSAKFAPSRGLALASFEGDASAYAFAVERGVDVHNNSWGYAPGFPIPPIVTDAIDTAFRQGRDPDGAGPEVAKGMVILFAAGNFNGSIDGRDISALPQAIAVGATRPTDERASFSSFGNALDIVAPGAGNSQVGIVTTDTTDSPVAVGYNFGGRAFDPEFFGDLGFADIETSGNYTGFFGGTSAACPIATGVAALVLSANQELTATDVRLVLTHTADRVSPVNAQYDPITSHSVLYGYGRVNAAQAVEAAIEAGRNGGFTWPDAPQDLVIDGSELRWKTGAGTDEYLAVESENAFAFIPEDGVCYDAQQSGCTGGLSNLPVGVRVASVGCDDSCSLNSEQSIGVARPAFGTKILAVFGRNATTGRYSFGVRERVRARRPPAVTIDVSPLAGNSPLTVRFKGNAISELPINDSRTAWDFNIKDAVSVNSSQRTTVHTYIAPPGETQVFIARLTMFDEEGNAGSSQVALTVVGPALPDQGEEQGASGLRIVVGIPGAPGTNVDTGRSPFSVNLSIDAPDAPEAKFRFVSWDLGDGTRATSLNVPHTYENETSSAIRIPITAVVTTESSTGMAVTTPVTRLITVQPGSAAVDLSDPQLPGTRPLGGGGQASPCGMAGMIPLMFAALGLVTLRRRRSRQ